MRTQRKGELKNHLWSLRRISTVVVLPRGFSLRTCISINGQKLPSIARIPVRAISLQVSKECLTQL